MEKSILRQPKKYLSLNETGGEDTVYFILRQLRKQASVFVIA